MNPAEKELESKAQQQIGGRQAFEQASAALRTGAYATADATLLAALVNHPNDPNLLRLLGISLTKQKRYAEAEERPTHVLRLVPQHAPAYDDLADAQMSQGKLEEALRSLRSCIKQDPAAQRPRQRLGELLSMMGRGGEAEAVFVDSLAASPTRQSLANAIEHVQREEYGKAEKIYDEVLRREPENFDALRLLGLLCVKRERYDDAAAFFWPCCGTGPGFLEGMD